MPLPCNCFCLPTPTFADCRNRPAATGAAAISANPQPGSVRCSAFTDYAPTRWRVNPGGIMYPMATGPLLTDSWQSAASSPGAGKSYYDTVTISGKDVGDVTLVRTYTAHPDPDFPATITYTNTRHLDEANYLGSPTARNLKNVYIIRVELGDPGATGFEDDYDPYTKWLGEIPCGLEITPAVDLESTPIPGSDYTYATISAEYTLELSGPYRTFNQVAYGAPYGYVTTTPSVIDTRDVYLEFTQAFLRNFTYGGRFGVGGNPIWTTPGQLFNEPALGGAASPSTYVLKSEHQFVDGFAPTDHPHTVTSSDAWLVDTPQPDVDCFISAEMDISLTRNTGKVQAYLVMNASVFSGTSSAVLFMSSSDSAPTLREDHNATWFDTLLEVNPANTGTTGIMTFYKSPNAFGVREGGEYKFRLIDFAVKYLGPS